MKLTSNLTKLALIAAIVFLAFTFWRPQTPAAALAPAAAGDDCSSSRSIQVSGTATVYVIPDQAMIQLGVQSNGTSPDATRDANVQAIQRVIAAVKALGIDAKDIATDYYLVYPVYDDYNSLVIKGYRINNTISITLHDVSRSGDVILVALKAGANEVQDVQFYTSELRKYRDQARDLAMKAAGEKGQSMARAAGAETGCVLSINENIWSHYYGSWGSGRNMGLMMQNVVQNVSSQAEIPQNEDSPISLGKIAVEAQVNASYSLK